MDICVKRLIGKLRRAKACEPSQSTSFNGEVNRHLFDHYLTPFMNGTVPTVGDLDFSQFTLEDVQDFGKYLECASLSNLNLMQLLNKFTSARPVAQHQRTFC